MKCPPCTGECRQGRDCPAKAPRELDTARVLGLILAATFAPIAFVWLIVTLVEAFA